MIISRKAVTIWCCCQSGLTYGGVGWCVHDFYLNATDSSSKKAPIWQYLKVGSDFYSASLHRLPAVWGLRKSGGCSVKACFYLAKNCCYECSGVQSILCHFCFYLTHKGRMFNCCIMSKMHGKRGRLDWIPEEILECFLAEMSSCLPISSSEVYLVGEGVIKSSLADGSTRDTLSSQWVFMGCLCRELLGMENLGVAS